MCSTSMIFFFIFLFVAVGMFYHAINPQILIIFIFSVIFKVCNFVFKLINS